MMNTWMLREERWNFKSEILNELQGHVVLHWCREKTPPEINKKCNFIKASWVWGRTPSTCKPRIYPHLSSCLCWSWGWRTLQRQHHQTGDSAGRWVTPTVLSHSVVSDSLRPHGPQPTKLLCALDFQARILEWLAISYSRGSSWPRDLLNPCLPGRFFTTSATWETDLRSNHDPIMGKLLHLSKPQFFQIRNLVGCFGYSKCSYCVCVCLCVCVCVCVFQ